MIHTTPSEMERMKIAKDTKKYGHLRSWKELFLFQRYCDATPQQIKEIGEWAKRKIKGERIRLPLMTHGIQENI